jgi:hypothetical protein
MLVTLRDRHTPERVLFYPVPLMTALVSAVSASNIASVFDHPANRSCRRPGCVMVSGLNP